jgi:hypothetical protein
LELVDKLRLGRSGRNAVEVRLLLLTESTLGATGVG